MPLLQHQRQKKCQVEIHEKDERNMNSASLLLLLHAYPTFENHQWAKLGKKIREINRLYCTTQVTASNKIWNES